MARVFLPVLLVVCLLVAASVEHPGSAAEAAQTTPHLRFQGHTADWWADRAVANRKRINELRLALRSDPQVVEAIGAACATYGHCSTLWRLARCESTLNPRAKNRSGATGLFQFMPSTWRTTPYSRMDITSPYASALAAGWMIVHGRGGEWVCR